MLHIALLLPTSVVSQLLTFVQIAVSRTLGSNPPLRHQPVGLLVSTAPMTALSPKQTLGMELNSGTIFEQYPVSK